jgi:hypothetical protein
MNLAKRVEQLETRSILRIARSVTETLPLDSPEDVLAVLGEEVNRVRSDLRLDPAERARTVGFLAGVALRAIEAKDLEARLHAVERVLKLRKDAEQQQRRVK